MLEQISHIQMDNGTEGQLQRSRIWVGTHSVELTSTNGCVYKQSLRFQKQ